jgi:hypothetical protein
LHSRLTSICWTIFSCPTTDLARIYHRA